ncbi:cell number regulator 10-like [Rosa rugosa]|uniref:cell number regulator 10-like n=1 Tax=Rosa rugosa TaxID=74645 RepID=UPI002B407E76|nr:cell number regulator 10-like [Rosa rugosa]
MTIFNRVKPEWSVGLCHCYKDIPTCCITCLLPCVTFGRIAEIVDEGRSSCFNQGCVYGLLMMVQCQWLYSCIYREKLRKKFCLPDQPCCDCCVHFSCELCALCQEHAELKARGFDPSKGWSGRPNALPKMHFSMFK